MNSKHLAGLALTALVAVGCGSSKSDFAGDTTLYTDVRGLHASRDLGPIDIFVSGERIVQSATFTQVSQFVRPPAGSIQVQVVPAGQNAPVLLDIVETFNQTLFYTVMAVGRATANPSNLRAVVVSDDGAVPLPGNFKLHFVHGVGPNTINVAAVQVGNSSSNWDVFFTPVETEADVPTFSNVPFAGQAPLKGGPAREFAAGTYQLRITQHDNPEIEFFRNDRFAFSAGQSLVIVGVPTANEGHGGSNGEQTLNEREFSSFRSVELLVTEQNGNTFIIPNSVQEV